ncbi:MAG: hypothetical protein WBE58_13975 [Verrucomicrobiales bacterium]
MLVTLASYSDAKDLKPLEPKSMINGCCYAGSRKDDKALGGYGPSDNAPKKITDKIPGTDGQITLVALPADSVPFMGQYLGFRLLLINRTATEAPFAASDSRLNIICEARDQSGEWKPIEYLSSSFCGNSYHSVYLPSGHYWEFSAPVYSGSLKTKLRYNLQGKQPTYSNEFDGSINPIQFKKPETPK